MSIPDYHAAIELQIPFHDLDPLSVVWHGNYAQYFEQARCELLEQFNYGYEQMRASGYLWPIIDLQIRYIKPLVFKQRIQVTAVLKEWEYRLKIDYVIRDALTQQRLTKGSTVQVAVDMATQELCIMSPTVLFERLGVTP